MSCRPPPHTATRRYREQPLPEAASDSAAELDDAMASFELDEVLERRIRINPSLREPDRNTVDTTEEST